MRHKRECVKCTVLLGMTLRPTWQEEKPDEDDAFEVMDSSGLQGLGLPTHFGAQKSSKVSSTLPY